MNPHNSLASGRPSAISAAYAADTSRTFGFLGSPYRSYSTSATGQPDTTVKYGTFGLALRGVRSSPPGSGAGGGHRRPTALRIPTMSMNRPIAWLAAIIVIVLGPQLATAQVPT